MTVEPGVAGSARLEERPEPRRAPSELLVEAVAIGVCGTDHEIVAGEHGRAPEGRDRLVLGHESVGRVLEAPADSDHRPGDLVVGIVRRPDPVPCGNCAVGEWDMCRNGRYTERGIVGRDGYLAERFTLAPDFAVNVPHDLDALAVLVEPASIVAKAWEHIDHIGSRARWSPTRVLVTGAGPIGLLAGLLGVQRGLDLHVLDQVEEGIKPDLVTELGGTYHTGEVADETCQDVDVVIEATGVTDVVFEVVDLTARNGIVCLTGVTSPTASRQVAAGRLARDLVLENDVVFGSVNANRRHYDQALDALVAVDREWLGRLITRRVPLDEWETALDDDPVRDVKTIVSF